MRFAHVLALFLGLVLFAQAVFAGDDDKPWFVGVGEKPKGPMSAAAVEKMITKGEIDGTTLAWQDGMADWLPLSEIARFRSLVVTPPPLPKQPPPLPKAAQPPVKSSPPPTSTSTATASHVNAKGKPPPMPSVPPLVMTPPPLPLPSSSPPPIKRRVIGASVEPPRKVKLVLAVAGDVRAYAEDRLAECNLRAGHVGVVNVVRGVVSVTSKPSNECVNRLLSGALAGAGVGDDEPFEIIVD